MKATLLIPLLIFSLALLVAASTIVVDNTVDPGDGICASPGCTLREAITAANTNPGADVINFNIAGSGVHTITPTSALPDITEAVIIDGYTQPGASENTQAIGNNAVLQIELNGTGAGVGSRGFHVVADGCTIRGLVINRFTLSGITIENGNDNLIEGNFIGTGPSGTTDLGNDGYAVALVSSDDNLIGGIIPTARNILSGNENAGILIQDSQGNQIAGNYIGTDKNGSAALGNTLNGIIVYLSSTGNVIGGTDAGAGNLISGNEGSGVSLGVLGLSTDSTDNLVQGNFIGTDATGTSPLRNSENGVVIDSENDNLVGGTSVETRNIISANPTGVLVTNGATDNLVQGNYIGTDVTGMMDLTSDDVDGVMIDDSPNNLIGGTVPGAGNLISGNFTNIQVQTAGATGNLIQGNLIGTDATGTAGIDFFGAGILLVGGSGTIIGGPAGAGNVIAFNGASGGIGVTSASNGNQIFGNSIFGNLGIGINLVGGTEDAMGVTANDFPDSDAGANNLQNYPVIDQIASDGEARTVEGSLTSNPNTDYVLNFYSNAEVDASGYGEGETWLGSLDVHTNAQSAVDFSFPLETGSLGRYITATATDPASNTSEFSMASELVPPLSRFLNISTRLKVQTGDNVLIGGFIITGEDPKQVIVRAIGPSLGGQGVSGPLGDPLLELHYQDGTVITNDDWRDDQENEIIATGIPPTNNRESAIVATLEPGPYTAIVKGANGGSGVGLVETYDLTSSSDSKLANISTRGFVETGDNVLIGGIIVGPDEAPSNSILLRAIGPSLADVGVANPLADPLLELHDANGDLIVSNDNWKSAQQAEIEATGIPPEDHKESAILADLVAGNYTAIVRGVGDTTGVGLVEAYHLE